MAIMEMIDIGVNLTNELFTNDITEVITRAQSAGVAQMIVTGCDLPHSTQAIALSKQYPEILFATAGIHPHYAEACTSTLKTALAQLSTSPEIVAIGECGLDYCRNLKPKQTQREVFEFQIELAIQTKKPLFLHQREAHADLLAIMDQYRHYANSAVVHCFTGDRNQLNAYLDRGWYIGITGWLCDERRGTHLHSLVRHIPRDRLMIETDAPYLLPRSMHPLPKKRRNEPCFLSHILSELAKYRGEPQEITVQNTTRVARHFFNLPSPQHARNTQL